MLNRSFFKDTQDCPQTEQSQKATPGFPAVSEPLLSQCVQGAWRHTELLVGQGCLAHITGRQRHLFYPSLWGITTDDRAACVLPETLMLGHVRGWVALEWVDAGSGSRLFLLIIIYITVIPSPSSFCSPRLWMGAIQQAGVANLLGDEDLCARRAHSIFFSEFATWIPCCKTESQLVVCLSVQNLLKACKIHHASICTLGYTVPDLPGDFTHTLSHNLCLCKELPTGLVLVPALS